MRTTQDTYICSLKMQSSVQIQDTGGPYTLALTPRPCKAAIICSSKSLTQSELSNFFGFLRNGTMLPVYLTNVAFFVVVASALFLG